MNNGVNQSGRRLGRVLLGVNLVLALGLVWNFWKARSAGVPGTSEVVETVVARELEPNVQLVAKIAPVPVSPFAAVYSTKPYEFAGNLRRVGCPEETVRDIIVAEINRRFRGREAELKPTPADHVPFGWSPRTSEAKLLERRQMAAGIAREKEAYLRTALGYGVRSEIPLYAMTTSDLRFQQTIQSLPEENRQAAFDAQERYWLLVEQLRSRTKGFWEPEDLRELNDLKKEWQATIDRLKEEQR